MGLGSPDMSRPQCSLPFSHVSGIIKCPCITKTTRGTSTFQMDGLEIWSLWRSREVVAACELS